MKTLNLAYPERSDIKYTIQKFPDGQQNVVIEEVSLRRASGTLPCKYECDCINPGNYPYQIKARLNDFKDLELIICAVASLRELGIEEIHLYTPYILGARSDRKFEDGGNNYIKSVIAPIINSLNFKTVTCIDPHSNVLEACIKGFRKESNLNLVKNAINSIYMKVYDNKPRHSTIAWEFNNTILNKFILVSPDAGASKKIYKIAEQISYKGDIITCSKERDSEGKLTRTVVPIYGNHFEKDIIIIDDICDGGATFINIAKEIKNSSDGSRFKGRLFLVVTHGIFSKGLTELAQYFDGIYTTNSYKNCNQLELLKVKQLNVF